MDELTSRLTDDCGKTTWTYLRVNGQRDVWTDRGTDAFVAKMPNDTDMRMNEHTDIWTD